MAGNGEEEEEDEYMSMTFADAAPGKKESSLQKATRKKAEGLQRGRVPSKAELAKQRKEAQEKILSTPLDSSSKGAQMLAKLGYKGGALGQVEGARTQPIELLMKDDRGGVGQDSAKKRKVRDAAEAALAEEEKGGEKRQRVSEEEFRERNRSEREDRRAGAQMRAAMGVLEGLEAGSEVDQPPGRLRDVNVLFRPLVKQRLLREREKKMRYDVNNSLSTRNFDEEDSDGQNGAKFDARADELDDADSELDEFETLSSAEALGKINAELREKHHYCFWCKYQYPDAEMDGCPGLAEDEHG